MGAVVLGTGSYLPKEVLDKKKIAGRYYFYDRQGENGEPIWEQENGELVTKILTEDHDRMYEIAGIKERRRADKDETAVSLGVNALRRALDDAKMSVGDLEAIICTSFISMDPSLAYHVWKEAGGKNPCYIVDVNSACAGFCHGLYEADKMIRQKKIGPVAVIATEVMTRMIDRKEITSALFGDGAGCVILAPGNDEKKGLISSFFISDETEEKAGWLFVDSKGILRMPKGKSVQKIASRRMPEAAKVVAAGRKVDILIPHQANIGVINFTAKILGFGEKDERVYRRGIEWYGNTSSATCAIGLDEMMKREKIREGDFVVLTASGAGIVTWAVGIQF